MSDGGKRAANLGKWRESQRTAASQRNPQRGG